MTLILNGRAVARLFGLPEQSVQNWLKNGVLPLQSEEGGLYALTSRDLTLAYLVACASRAGSRGKHLRAVANTTISTFAWLDKMRGAILSDPDGRLEHLEHAAQMISAWIFVAIDGARGALSRSEVPPPAEPHEVGYRLDSLEEIYAAALADANKLQAIRRAVAEAAPDQSDDSPPTLDVEAKTEKLEA